MSLNQKTVGLSDNLICLSLRVNYLHETGSQKGWPVSQPEDYQGKQALLGMPYRINLSVF